MASGYEAVLDVFEPHVRVDDGPEGVGYVASGSRDADKLFEALGRGVTHCHSANGDHGVELVGVEGEGVAKLGAVKALVGILGEGLLHHFLGHVEAEEVPISASEKAFTHQAGACADVEDPGGGGCVSGKHFCGVLGRGPAPLTSQRFIVVFGHVVVPLGEFLDVLSGVDAL